MYSKPIQRDDIKIYRLNRKIRVRHLIITIFVMIFTPLSLFAFSLNSKGQFVEDMFVYGLLGVLFVGWIWLVFHVLFVIRLETDPTGGRFYSFGKVTSFDWQDAYHLDYVHWDRDNKFHLYLYLYHSDIKRTFTLPYLSFFPIRFSENIIPVDLLYKYVSFTSLTINRGLPTLSEQSIHLRYFIRTELGQDLIRYAPQVFGTALSKYLPDNDLHL